MTDIQRQMAENAMEAAELRERVKGVTGMLEDFRLKLHRSAQRQAALLRLCEDAEAQGLSTLDLGKVKKCLGWK